MDAKTLKALKASIRKWRKNSKAKTPESFMTSPSDCPLCQMFFNKECNGCPVRQKTRQMACGGSPYKVAYLAWDYWLDDPDQELRKTGAHAAALDEVAFLESLLPEGETA